jgi:hypothetical protein
MNGEGFMLLPAKKGTCPSCAVDHKPEEPHDATSLYYAFWFQSHHGRASTWKDAVAHCEPDVRRAWEETLQEMGRWTSWEGDTPPPPDVLPIPGYVGTVTKFNAEDDVQDRIQDVGCGRACGVCRSPAGRPCHLDCTASSEEIEARWVRACDACGASPRKPCTSGCDGETLNPAVEEL